MKSGEAVLGGDRRSSLNDKMTKSHRDPASQSSVIDDRSWTGKMDQNGSKWFHENHETVKARMRPKVLSL